MPLIKLAQITSIGFAVERLSLSLEAFDTVAPIMYFDRSINYPSSDRNPAYLIWGGMAANLLLMAMGRTSVFYSLHDIELLGVIDGCTAAFPVSLSHIDLPVPGHSPVRLRVGRTQLPPSCYGLSVADFQSKRVEMCDGDLYLNNLAFLVDRSTRRLDVYCPSGIFEMLLSSGGYVDVKPHSSLQGAERLARRLTRSIAKATRLWQMAGLPASASMHLAHERLITQFLSLFIPNRNFESSLSHVTCEWASANAIHDLAGAGQWLFEAALSETIKRLAGVNRLGQPDKRSFDCFLRKALTPSYLIDRMPLLRISKTLIERITSESVQVLADPVVQRCYDDFLKYQCSDAYLLVSRLSRELGPDHGNKISALLPASER